LNALTDLGDAAILLPLSIVMLVWLLKFHSHRATVSWVIAIGLCLAGTALLKILFYGCPPVSNLVSPSGHTSLSMLVYASIALVVASEGRGWKRNTILAAGTALIVGIAASRLVLNKHSALEVGSGFLIGAMTLPVFARGYLRSRGSERPLLPLVLSAIAVVAIFHGQELRAESILHAISRYVHVSGNVCAAHELSPR
jgi:membrane-associated phospholipid phosphatase